MAKSEFDCPHCQDRGWNSDDMMGSSFAACNRCELGWLFRSGSHLQRNYRPYKIYVASSWRNKHQPDVCTALKEFGHEVYDFRNLPSVKSGFGWSEIDPNWEQWTREQYRTVLNSHPRAEEGYNSDLSGMLWADACVMVMPCGNSAHLEAGFFAGAGKKLLIYIPDEFKADLMYRMADRVCLKFSEVLVELADRRI